MVLGADAFTVAKVPLPPVAGGMLLLGPIGPPGPIMPGPGPGPPGPIMPPPIGPPGPPGPIIGLGPGPPIMGGPLGRMAMLSMLVGDESWPDRLPGGPTGLPSGPRMEPPSGEFIMPGSKLPIEPRPLSGPGPMELGVEQGVEPWPVSCWDICAMLLMGSKALPAMLQVLLFVLEGVAGLSGKLLELSGGRPSC